MTELNPPGFLQNRADHPARELRNAISGLIATPGIVSVGDWIVTQRGAGANMSVDIAGGSGYIAGTENVNQGFYHCVSDATIVNKAVGASSGTQARKDIVVARVYDQFYSGATNLWQFEVIAGTFGSGTEPTVPANSYKVATIDITISAVSIVNANITPRTQQYSVNHTPVFVANQAARDALVLYVGLRVYRLDLLIFETYNGTAWTGQLARFRGTLGSAVAITGGAAMTFTVAEDNMSGWSVNAWTAPMTGTYLVTGMIRNGATGITNQQINFEVSGTVTATTPNFTTIAFGGGQLSKYLRLTAGQFVRMYAGVSYTTANDTSANNWLEIVQIAA